MHDYDDICNSTNLSNGIAGSPCVLAIFFFSPLVSYGVMAILFPLVQLKHSSPFIYHFLFFFLEVDTCFYFGYIYGTDGCVFQFVLTATGSGAEEIISLKRRQWKGAGLGRLPIFCAADTLS